MLLPTVKCEWCYAGGLVMELAPTAVVGGLFVVIKCRIPLQLGAGQCTACRASTLLLPSDLQGLSGLALCT